MEFQEEQNFADEHFYDLPKTMAFTHDVSIAFWLLCIP